MITTLFDAKMHGRSNTVHKSSIVLDEVAEVIMNSSCHLLCASIISRNVCQEMGLQSLDVNNAKGKPATPMGAMEI